MTDTTPTRPELHPQPNTPCPGCGRVPEVTEWRADIGVILEQPHEDGCVYGPGGPKETAPARDKDSLPGVPQDGH